MRTVLVRLSVCLAAAVLVAGCQSLAEKRKIDYRNTTALPPLEVPPDLASLPEQRLPGAGQIATPGTASHAGAGDPGNPATSAREGVLPQYPGVKLARDGQARYLVVAGEPGQYWERVREFVVKAGLTIVVENPAIGLIETEWTESRALVSPNGYKAATKWLSGFYATPVRDMYRFRLERGAASGTTEIYAGHRGMEQIEANVDKPGQAGWRPRPSDPELEAELLQRLVAHVVGDPKAAKVVAAAAPPAAVPTPNARLTRDGNGLPLLALQDGLDRAWRRVGLSLDRIGFTVEDRDRSKGVYFVRYIDPDSPAKKQGFVSRMRGDGAPASSNLYQLHIKPGETGTSVEVLDKDGGQDATKVGERILSLLYEQLK